MTTNSPGPNQGVRKHFYKISTYTAYEAEQYFLKEELDFFNVYYKL
jgi:hypothetical protein